MKSNTLYQPLEDVKNADAIILSLVFSWIMWKFPLVIFTLKVVLVKKMDEKKNKSKRNLAYATWGFYLLLLLLIDIMTTIFRPEGYQDWIYFVVYFVLSVVLVGINGYGKRKRLFKNIKNYLLPICYIAFAYASFTLLIPGIYNSIYNGLN